MTDARQRVVLGADADLQRAAAEFGAKRGVQTAGRLGDRESTLGDQRLRLGAAAMFGERQLGLGVDGVRQLERSSRRRCTTSSRYPTSATAGISQYRTVAGSG